MQPYAFGWIPLWVSTKELSKLFKSTISIQRGFVIFSSPFWSLTLELWTCPVFLATCQWSQVRNSGPSFLRQIWLSNSWMLWWETIYSIYIKTSSSVNKQYSIYFNYRSARNGDHAEKGWPCASPNSGSAATSNETMKEYLRYYYIGIIWILMFYFNFI